MRADLAGDLPRGYKLVRVSVEPEGDRDRGREELGAEHPRGRHRPDRARAAARDVGSWRARSRWAIRTSGARIPTAGPIRVNVEIEPPPPSPQTAARRELERGRMGAARQLFGTDGIRGRANVYPMTGEVMLELGRALALVFKLGPHGPSAPRVLIGKDTRLSGYMLEDALAAGLCSMGVDVLQVGPIPTPGTRLPDRRHALRRGRDDLRLAQPVRRQRRQVLLARRLQAPRRARGADRAADGLARARARARARRRPRPRAANRRRVGALHRVPQEELSAPEDPGRAADRDRLRERSGLQGGTHGAAGARRRGDLGRRPPERHQHQRGAAARPTPRTSRRSRASTARTSASPSTATRTGSS